MRQTSFSDFRCSLAQSLEIVGDWWTPLIVRDISLGLTRFEQLADDLGISRNLLTTRLQDLETHGVVERRRYVDRPPRYEYRLTRAGVELVPILMALTAWGDRWATPPGGGGVRYRHRPCGHSFVPTVSCSACGAPVRAADVIPRPGPGSAEAPGTRLLPEQLRRLATASRASQA